MPSRSSRRSFLEGSSVLVVRPSTVRRAPLDPAFKPAYLALQRSGELRRRGEALYETMASCRLCPRECAASRLDGEEGFCGASAQLRVASFHPHFGEERPLVGSGGSGTLFFTHCSLRCVFCINWEISQGGEGRDRSVDELAHMMLGVQELGCHNVNNLMSQYRPEHEALGYPKIARRLTRDEYQEAVGWARDVGLTNLDVQGRYFF